MRGRIGAMILIRNRSAAALSLLLLACAGSPIESVAYVQQHETYQNQQQQGAVFAEHDIEVELVSRKTVHNQG